VRGFGPASHRAAQRRGNHGAPGGHPDSEPGEPTRRGGDRGSALDPDDYALRVEGQGPAAGIDHLYLIGISEELVLSELRPGPYLLELVEVAENCAVAGDNPRTVTVAAREETVSTFQVTCAV
jgi:hypothetical protein